MVGKQIAKHSRNAEMRLAGLEYVPGAIILTGSAARPSRVSFYKAPTDAHFVYKALDLPQFSC
jgi:hypothetical protein